MELMLLRLHQDILDMLEQVDKLGGGGSGSKNHWSDGGTAGRSRSGAGASGTSYSGGTGGGGVQSANKSPYWREAGAGQANGGAGGTAFVAGQTASPGAGNPSGGTGGLLVVYVHNYAGNGQMQARGSSSYTGWATGGSSGGGSINFFYENESELTKDKCSVAGGIGVGNPLSGAGGAGTITMGKWINKEFFIE